MISLQDLGLAFRQGTLHPRELLEEHLARIEQADPRWGPIFATVTAARAVTEAEASARRHHTGRACGSLDGLPIVWKDVFDVAGTVTRAGTLFLDPAPASRDAAVVAAAQAAGTVCLAKTTLSELAYSVLGENTMLGTPINPLDDAVARAPGGSSSGAAVAVARGLAPAAVGTDCGGSIRLPAAWCGLVGFKPTAGAIPSGGALPFSPSLDTVGPITRSVEDAGLLFQSLSSSEPTTAYQGQPSFHVPYLPQSLQTDPQVASLFDTALRRLRAAGLTVEQTNWAIIEELYAFRLREGSLALLEGTTIWAERVREARTSVSLRLHRSFEQCPPVDSRVLKRLRQRRRALIGAFASRLQHNNYLLLPTSPIPPPPLQLLADDRLYDDLYALAHAYLWPFNLLDAPALTLPCGWTEKRLPVGLLIVAAPRQDWALLQAAGFIESALKAASS